MVQPAMAIQEQPAGSGKTLVVGLGKTGLSCARYLTALGAPTAVIDSRQDPPGLEALREQCPDAALFLGGFDEAVFLAADQLVLSPGVAADEPQVQAARARGIPVLGDVELFARAVRAPVAAITGSNGKSTVTTLLGEMAQQAGREVRVGGNLGRPALDLLDPAAELYVLELSSFQLETVESLAPEAAVVLNVAADHLDRHGDLANYAAIKSRIYRRARRRVFNRDDPRVRAMAGVAAAGDLGFSLQAPSGEADFGLASRDGRWWMMQGDRPLLAADELRIAGRHNLLNGLAALALGSALGLEMEPMLAALRRFRGLPHRTQFVGEQGGVRWYNDSKGTNVGAAIAGLEGFEGDAGKTVLIAGGDCKGADFSALRPVVERTARAVVLIGRDAPCIEQALRGAAPLQLATSLEEAVALAAELSQAGDRVLLSPACASFDMFRNYEDRGERFVRLVGKLTQ